MTDCTQLSFELPGLCGRKIEGNFAGGNLSSDGGLVLLRQVDRFMGLTKELAKRLPDGRDADKIEHSLQSLLRQRIYGLALVTKISMTRTLCVKTCCGRARLNGPKSWGVLRRCAV
jgi:hypothetical protein